MGFREPPTKAQTASTLSHLPLSAAASDRSSEKNDNRTREQRCSWLRRAIEHGSLFVDPRKGAVFKPKGAAVGANLGTGTGMTKSELIDLIANRGELTKTRAEQVVNCVFEAMAEALERGEGIEIRGFGSFSVRPYKPYNGRNPRTGEKVPVPAKKLPFFKVGKELKGLVNDSRHIAISGGDDDDDDDN
jgi:integration host factor subunit beta